jgi:Ca2+-transporting ATPase
VGRYLEKEISGMSNWHSMEVTQVVNELDTDPHKGLTEEDVKRRLEKYGANEMKREDAVSPFTLFVNQFKNVLIIILLIAICLSAAVGEVIDAAIIGVIVVFCAALGFFQEYRAERALEALKKMLSPTITALRGGKEEEVLTKSLVPGDILLLEAGDKIH